MAAKNSRRKPRKLSDQRIRKKPVHGPDAKRNEDRQNDN
jgi:hypothetical protein